MIMKKILFSVVCLMMVGMQSVMAQIGIAALHHEGKVTVFGEDKLANAIEASVEGDSIYLSEGHFLGNITVNKAIHLIGSGQGTIIDGDVTISIDNTPTLEGYLLTGMHIIGDIIPDKSLNGLRISLCYFTNYGRLKSGNASDRITVSDLYIERSHCTKTMYLGEVESGNLYSCKIYQVYNYYQTGRTTLNHCNFYSDHHPGNSSIGYFAINCIFRGQMTTYNSYQNCLSGWSANPSTAENCWPAGSNGRIDGVELLDDNLNCSLSDEELRTRGYIATDGSVVGITGGDAPFTLDLATPKVLEHHIEVDKATRKLNVTLKVGVE